MNTEYISIKDFAEKAGVSQQSIYKRLQNKDDELQRFYKEIDGKKYISLSALDAIYGKQEPQETPKEENKTADSILLTLLQQQLESMQRDIEAKNIQIQNLNDRLAEANTIISQQQKLSLFEKQKIEALEAAAEEKEKAAAAAEESAEESEEAEAAEDAAEEVKKRKSIFNFFKRKK